MTEHFTKWIHSFSQCISICEGLAKFVNIHTTSSEHCKDLCPNRKTRDHKDFETFLQWLKGHSLFTFSNHTSVVVISTGMVADSCVNCDLGASLLYRQSCSRITLHCYVQSV